MVSFYTLEEKIKNTLEKCKVNGQYDNALLLLNKETLYSYIHELSMHIDVTTMNYQDISLLYKSNSNHIWSTGKVVEDYIDVLKHLKIISVNYNKTLFKIHYHTLNHIVKHASNLIDVIGDEMWNKILLLPEKELEVYLNSNKVIKHAFEFDKQNWIEGYEHGK